MKIITRVDEVAEPLGWTISSLSRKADLGYGTVYNIWQHNTASPDLLTLAKIASILQVPLTDLYTVVRNDVDDDPEIIKILNGQAPAKKVKAKVKAETSDLVAG